MSSISRKDRIRVCKALLSTVRLQDLWDWTGPTPRALELLRQYGGPMSNSEWVVFQMAWYLWGRTCDLRVDDLFRLESEPRTRVISLLEALSLGTNALQRWLSRYESSGLQRVAGDRPESGRMTAAPRTLQLG